MKQNKFALCMLAFVFSMMSTTLFTACSDDDDTPRPGDGQKIAAIMKANDPYWQHVAKGVADAAKEAGLTADIFYAGADVDPEGQLATLNKLDLTQYKGIVIGPSDPGAMITDIKKVAAQLPVVIVDTPVDEAVGYHSFIGMDNKAAGKQLHDEMIRYGEQMGMGGSDQVPTLLVFQLAGSPAIAERVEGYVAAANDKVEEVKVITVPDDPAQIATKYTEAITAMEGKPYSLFAANGTVADALLAEMDRNDPGTILLAFDVTQPILKAIGQSSALTMAQDNYGYGYEGVKAILAPATGKATMLTPKFITPTNVRDADVARYLNGYEAPEVVTP